MSELLNFEKVLQDGVAKRTWGIRGQTLNGTGKRSPAKIWKRGVSGKQNKSSFVPQEETNDLVAVFSDSQLRPVVEGLVPAPKGWYFNSTPGGCFWHLSQEVKAAKIPGNSDPRLVALLVGTNDMSQHFQLERARNGFNSLLSTVKKTFKSSKVLVVSILPRLDEFQVRLDGYHHVMAEECKRLGVCYKDVRPNFPNTDRRLWSFRDAIHISEDRGIPLLLTLLRQAVREQLSSDLVESIRPQPEKRICQKQQGSPAWFKREQERQVKGTQIIVKVENNRRSTLNCIQNVPSNRGKKESHGAWSRTVRQGIIIDSVVVRHFKPGFYRTETVQNSNRSTKRKRGSAKCGHAKNEGDKMHSILKTGNTFTVGFNRFLQETAGKEKTLPERKSREVIKRRNICKASSVYGASYADVVSGRTKVTTSEANPHFAGEKDQAVAMKTTKKCSVIAKTKVNCPDATHKATHNGPSFKAMRCSTLPVAQKRPAAIGILRRSVGFRFFVGNRTHSMRSLPFRDIRHQKAQTPIAASSSTIAGSIQKPGPKSHFGKSFAFGMSLASRLTNMETSNEYRCSSTHESDDGNQSLNPNHADLFETPVSRAFPDGIKHGLRFHHLKVPCYRTEQKSVPGRNKWYPLSLARCFKPCFGGTRPKVRSSLSDAASVSKLQQIMASLGIDSSANRTINWPEICRMFYGRKLGKQHKLTIKLRNLYYANKDVVHSRSATNDKDEYNVHSIEKEAVATCSQSFDETIDNTIDNTQTSEHSSSYIDNVNNPAESGVRGEQLTNVPVNNCSNNLLENVTILDVEARYIGKMFAEVAKSLSQRRFPMANENNSEPAREELNNLCEKICNREVSKSSLPYYKERLPCNVVEPTEVEGFIKDSDFVPIDEKQVILGEVKTTEAAIDDIYSSDLMRGLARSKDASGMEANIILAQVSVPLTSDWQLISPTQNLNRFGSPTRLRYNSESIKYFGKILARHSPYCCWNVYENYVRQPGSRKESCVYFRARAKCMVDGCKHNCTMTIGSANSLRMQIHFKEMVRHRRGSLAAGKIMGNDRDQLATYFVENPTVPPSQKYRDDLRCLDEVAFAAGNMSGVGTSNNAYQQIASLARRAATSCETLRGKVIKLQHDLRKADEEEALGLRWAFLNEFGYIQKPIINPDNVQIILVDQIMTMLYHEHVRNDVLYIDATGSVTNQVKWLSKVLYYVAVIRHPYGKTPPLPVAEYITNKHDQFAIEDFLRMIHEKEYRRYKEVTNPRMIMTDFSWAIILACLKVFCNESLTDHLNRMYRIVTGEGSEIDLNKTRLHVCAAHMMKLNKKHATAKYCRNFDEKSQVHFAMRFFGRLMNCDILDDAVGLVEDAKAVMTSKLATTAVRKALQRISASINTFDKPQFSNQPDVDQDSFSPDLCTDIGLEPLNTKSQFHQLWQRILNSAGLSTTAIGIEEERAKQSGCEFNDLHVEQEREDILAPQGKCDVASIEDKIDLENNRYYMPSYFEWLQSKLPYISFWSNICLGDQSRHSENYSEIENCYAPKTYLDANTTNAYAEHFFNMKKLDSSKLRLPIDQFIRKCWEDQKGLRRHFLNGLLVGMAEEEKGRTASGNPKKTVKNKWKKTIKKLCQENDQLLVDEDHEVTIHTLEESWSKKPLRQDSGKQHKKTGTYQKPPQNPLYFSPTISDKLNHKRKGQVIETENPKIAKRSLKFNDLKTETITESTGNKNLGDADIMTVDSFNEAGTEMQLSPSEKPGFSVFQNKFYDRAVRRSFGSIMQLKRNLRLEWHNLPQNEKESYINEASKDKEPCSLCGDNNAPSPDLETHVEHWVTCYLCLKWFHQKCVLLDKTFCDVIDSFVCPKCAKSHFLGFANFIYSYRYKIPEEVEDIFERCSIEWDSMSGEQKEVVSMHIYTTTPVFPKKTAGPLRILSKHGLKNRNNVCYLSSLLQVICGSVVYSLLSELPKMSSIMKLLQSVHESLRQPGSRPLEYTAAMKEIKTIVTGDSAESRVQCDSFECLTKLISTIMFQEDYCAVRGIFEARILSIRKCIQCQSIKGNIQNSSCIYLPVANTNYHHCSIQSLLWDWCTLSESNHVVGQCKCQAYENNFIQRSYLMFLPAVLVIVLDRNVFDKTTCTGVIKNIPIDISSKIDLKNIVLGTTAKLKENYTLLGVINFIGKTNILDGHYTCTLFGQNDAAITFNDSTMKRGSKASLLKTKFFEATSRVLFYIKDEVLETSTDCPWETSLNPYDIEDLEEYWFGLHGLRNTCLSLSDFRSLSGKNELPSDIIYYFLKSVITDFGSKHDDEEVLSEVLPTQFMTALLNHEKQNRTLCRALMLARLYISVDLLLIPFHQSNHWSIIGVYLKEKVIVHCDSRPSRESDLAAFQAVIEYLSKCNAYLKTASNLTRYRLISLSEAGLQQQFDNVSCGVFACVFAYSLLSLKDYEINTENLPTIRYWIANEAIKGTEATERHPVKCRNQDLWDKLPFSTDRIQRPTKLRITNDIKPFAALQKFLSGEKQWYPQTLDAREFEMEM